MMPDGVSDGDSQLEPSQLLGVSLARSCWVREALCVRVALLARAEVLARKRGVAIPAAIPSAAIEMLVAGEMLDCSPDGKFAAGEASP